MTAVGLAFRRDLQTGPCLQVAQADLAQLLADRDAESDGADTWDRAELHRSAWHHGGGPRTRSWEPRTLRPSVRAKASCTQARKPSSNPLASSRAKTHPGVSCEGMPCGSPGRCAAAPCGVGRRGRWPRSCRCWPSFAAPTASGCPSGGAAGSGRPAPGRPRIRPWGLRYPVPPCSRQPGPRRTRRYRHCRKSR